MAGMAAEDRASAADVDAFIAELRHWRDVAGLSRKALSERMGYDPSYVGKIESKNARPTVEFAERADDTLRAGGAIVRRWREYDLSTRQGVESPRPIHPVREPPQPPVDLVVEHDHAELRYGDGKYRTLQRRQITNCGTGPITSYLIRISVDRHPGDPELSNELYRENPLTWDELKLYARREGDEMAWRVKQDRDAFKEVWLLFENRYGKFPLYPGESTWIEYGYTVSETKWGNWYQRAVRLPTNRLSVRLFFPRQLEPTVWGMETSMTAEAYPFRTAIERTEEGDESVFSWATDEPPLHARYRLEWNFRNPPKRLSAPPDAEPTPSEKMASIGIVQRDAPILRRSATPFRVPEEAEDARRVVAELFSAIERARGIHYFAKGLGVAAPQIGIGRAAAVVRTSDGRSITLLNPVVIEESADSEEHYEGCWSFFDVRGKVPRPVGLTVEHQEPDGTRRSTLFEGAVARLVGHEVDHLNGVLYTDRMPAGTEPIPVSEYSGSGSPWPPPV
jgi:peptide deformylase